MSVSHLRITDKIRSFEIDRNVPAPSNLDPSLIPQSRSYRCKYTPRKRYAVLDNLDLDVMRGARLDRLAQNQSRASIRSIAAEISANSRDLIPFVKPRYNKDLEYISPELRRDITLRRLAKEWREQAASPSMSIVERVPRFCLWPSRVPVY